MWPLSELFPALLGAALFVVVGSAPALGGEGSVVRLDDNALGLGLYSRQADGARMVHIPKQSAGEGKNLPAFLIDDREISQRQYLRFMSARGTRLPGLPRIKQGDDHPVVGVPWVDAAAYCAWVEVRLPTEIEWLQAAGRFVDGRAYPWGDVWIDGRANTAFGNDEFICTAPVGNFPDGASPFGVLDLAGNAEEWVDGESEVGRHVALGGSWRSTESGDLRLDRRTLLSGDEAGQWVGFRCAADTPDGTAPGQDDSSNE